jgi:predicted DsbA family dithiol-disulfide isomerase
MKIEIWSDVVCPFCFIAKRHFEHALQKFNTDEPIEIEWKSFLLNPSLKTQPGKHITQYLAEIKDITLEQARAMNAHVTEMAAQAGLAYDFDKVIVANSVKAHRLIQLAKKKGVADAMEEALFSAYFIDGKNIDEDDTLLETAHQVGMDLADAKAVLAGDQYLADVNSDINEAHELGLRGVPFFVINRKYGISGAQPEEVFLETFRKAAGQ